MKKSLLALAIALVVLAALATVVMADNGPHGSFTSSTDACASCHRAHSAQFGDNSLLIQSPDEVCLECHNGEGAGTNVLYGVWNQGSAGAAGTDAAFGGSDSYYGGSGTTVQGTDGGSLLAGGFEYATMSTLWTGANFYDPATATAPTSRATTSHHTYDGTTGTLWGSGGINSTAHGISYSLECISCHSPHGNAGFINGAVAYPETFTAINDNTPNNTAAATYRLLRWQPDGSNGFEGYTSGVNWSGGAFKSNGASTPVTGWLVPDNYRASNHDEWYTIEARTDYGSQKIGFAASDYAAGNGANVYAIVKDLTLKKDYTNAAVNVAFFCAQCHDRYFNNSSLRSATDSSDYCGSPTEGKVAGTKILTYYPPTAGGLHPTYPDDCEAVYTGSVITGWGDTRSSGDTVYSFKHTSGDVRLSLDGTVNQGAGNSLSRSCLACHVAHGSAAQMTDFASSASLATGSVLLRLDNRSMCLRCHASTVGFVVTPNAAASATASAAPNTTWLTQTAVAAKTLVPVPTQTSVAGLTSTAIATIAKGTATQAMVVTATANANATATQAAANTTATAAANLTATANANATATAAANATATSACATTIAGAGTCP